MSIAAVSNDPMRRGREKAGSASVMTASSIGNVSAAAPTERPAIWVANA
jgi:hypothetical protein